MFLIIVITIQIGFKNVDLFNMSESIFSIVSGIEKSGQCRKCENADSGEYINSVFMTHGTRVRMQFFMKGDKPELTFIECKNKNCMQRQRERQRQLGNGNGNGSGICS